MTEKVLIIEDRRDTVRTLKDGLEHGGYAVDSEETGEEGLDRVESFSPDIVILDLMLPDMGGMEVLKEMRKEHDSSDIKVIILTAATLDADEEQEYMDAGADRFLEKPIHVKDLNETVEAVLEGYSRME